jgi:hypothetical protein
LPDRCSFLVEAKHSAFADDSEFSRKPIEHPLIQFVMLREDSKVVKDAGHLF